MSATVWLKTMLSVSPRELLTRTRRNHALEHATMNLLVRRYPDAQIAGMSGPLGFTLLSSLTGEQIIPTVRQALGSLKVGQGDLALHENCGTNLVVTAALTTVATLAGLGAYALPQSRETRTPRGLLERLPRMVLLNVAALAAASPLSRWVQAKVTTNADVKDMEIASVVTDYRGRLHHISVHTRHGRAA
jgi:hypothetical protein